MAYHNERMRVVAIDKEAAEFRRQTEKIKFEIAQEELAQLKRRRTENGKRFYFIFEWNFKPQLGEF